MSHTTPIYPTLTPMTGHTWHISMSIFLFVAWFTVWKKKKNWFNSRWLLYAVLQFSSWLKQAVLTLAADEPTRFLFVILWKLLFDRLPDSFFTGNANFWNTSISVQTWIKCTISEWTKRTNSAANVQNRSVTCWERVRVRKNNKRNVLCSTESNIYKCLATLNMFNTCMLTFTNCSRSNLTHSYIWKL